MQISQRAALVGIGGAVLGALCLSVGLTVTYAVLIPGSTGDGQFIMVYIISAPMGAAFGAASSVAFTYHRAGLFKTCRKALRVGAVLLLAPAAFLLWLSAGSRGGGIAEYARTAASPPVSVIGALGLVLLIASVLVRLRDPLRQDT